MDIGSRISEALGVVLFITACVLVAYAVIIGGTALSKDERWEGVATVSKALAGIYAITVLPFGVLILFAYTFFGG